MPGRRGVLGIGLALGLIVLALVGRLVPTYYTGLMTEALILGIFAVSLNLLLGHTGLPSLGHSAYFGAAGYTMAILSLRLMQNSWVSASAGIVVSLIIAAIFGLLALVVVIIGGLGSIGGAFVGSLVVGLIDTFGRALVPELAMFTIFAPMAIILAVRPRGLFGRI